MTGVRVVARGRALNVSEAEGDRIAEAVRRLVASVRAEAAGSGRAIVDAAALARADLEVYRRGLESWPISAPANGGGASWRG